MTRATDEMLESAKNAFLRVGDGRGFLVETHRGCLVVTSAHCLPHLPPPHPASYTEERTYRDLLAPLGATPAVCAECLFVDPVSDLAVLGEPDSQELYDEWEAYESLVEGRPKLRIGVLSEPHRGWLLTLGGRWESCILSTAGPRSSLVIAEADEEAYTFGTSGSPVLASDGRVVGVISSGEQLNPVLAKDLPAGLLADLMQTPPGSSKNQS